jgi:hypothetical protein
MKSRDYTLAEQYSSLKFNYPHFETKMNMGVITVFGEIRPTARSASYKFNLTYKVSELPKVKIIEPELIKNFNGDNIPHVYPGNRLCLYYPKYKEFNSSKLVSDCIIPWVSLWLYHYENWHMTGTWEGGGIHPKLGMKKQ